MLKVRFDKQTIYMLCLKYIVNQTISTVCLMCLGNQSITIACLKCSLNQTINRVHYVPRKPVNNYSLLNVLRKLDNIYSMHVMLCNPDNRHYELYAYSSH